MSSRESTAVLLASYFHYKIPQEVPARNEGSLGWLSYLETPKDERRSSSPIRFKANFELEHQGGQAFVAI